MRDGHDDESRWTRADVLAAGLCLAVSAATRLPGLGAIGLTHFDESGYAMSARAVADGRFPADGYPLQHFLSPPLLFGLAGSLMRVLGTTSELVLLGSTAAFGVVLPVVVFALGRRAAGMAAGLVAGLFVALSDAHAIFSRTGLTDEPFCALLLAALLAFAYAEDRGSLRVALLAGALTGLAWNTKYHGWLAVVVAGLALVPRLRASERVRLRDGARRLLVAAVVAALLYVPWAIFIQTREGGYARLTQQHERFLMPGSAARSAVTQFASQIYLDGWLSRSAAAAGFLAAAVAHAGPAALRRVAVLGVVLALLATGTAAGGVSLLAVAAVAGVPRMLRSKSQAARIVVALFVVFTVLTPLYKPYARLMIPWLVAASLLAGAGLSDFAERVTRGDVSIRRLVVAIWIAGAAAAVVLGVSGLREPPQTWGPAPGFRRASAALSDLLRPDESVVVIGEPAVVFCLRGAGRACRHADRPDEIGVGVRDGADVAVVIGHYARATGGFAKWRAAHASEVTALGRFPASVGEVRRLDDYAAPIARERRADPRGEYDLELFRVRVTGPR